VRPEHHGDAGSSIVSWRSAQEISKVLKYRLDARDVGVDRLLKQRGN
jgi:hypothetical protein